MFLHTLEEQGHSKKSVATYRHFSTRLCDVAQERNIDPEGLDIGLMAELADACPTTGTSCMQRELAMVARRFTRYLVDSGVIVRRDPPQPPAGSTEAFCAELDDWLRSQRGMHGPRLQTYPRILTGFVQHCCKETGTVQDLATVTPGEVLGHVDTITGKGRWRIPYLRNILRFLFWSNHMPRDLSAVIPRMANTRTDGLPRHLAPETVERLLEAIRGESPRDRRDHAMLLVMARLGLRAQEVVAMRLDDIDWNIGRIHIRGKQGQIDHMPLPVDVGTAIVNWLRHGRRGNSRHVFVSLYPPFAALGSSLPIRRALRRAYRRAGLTPPRGQVRTHALRHSLAMRLLGQGSSLEEIGDVLRHRCMASTTTYARHDVEGLRELARPWPVKEAGT